MFFPRVLTQAMWLVQFVLANLLSGETLETDVYASIK
jgi:hypothetical protein